MRIRKNIKGKYNNYGLFGKTIESRDNTDVDDIRDNYNDLVSIGFN